MKAFISSRPIKEIPNVIPGIVVELYERDFQRCTKFDNRKSSTFNYSVITEGGAICLCLPRAYRRHEMCVERMCEEERGNS